MKRTLALLGALLWAGLALAQTAWLEGQVLDQDGRPIRPEPSVAVVGGAGTYTRPDGRYELELPSGEALVVRFSCVGYQSQEFSVRLGPGSRQELSPRLQKEDRTIGEVRIEEVRRHESVMTLDPKVVSVLPSVSGDFNALLFSQLGVSSNNELSSQYSVRGGNFDENLVYVNDIEVYRPFLVRSGEQEGLSFINPDMVSSVVFSAGGFEAKYGDKMSSVLDVRYKRPRAFAASAAGSLLGASAHLEGMSRGGRLTHVSGLRYKTARYILGSLETTGDYFPSFIDFQSFVNFEVNDKLDLAALVNAGRNSFVVLPDDRSSSFGTLDIPLNIFIDFEGSERDSYTTLMGALTADYHPTDDLRLKFFASAFDSREQETFDIQGRYSLNLVDRQLDSDTYGDSVANIGVGRYLEHARNFLDMRVVNLYHKGYWAQGGQDRYLQWGAKLQGEFIDDQLKEWFLLDSAGYSLPFSDSLVLLNQSVRAQASLRSARAEAYLQQTLRWDLPRGGELIATAGARANYWTYNGELLLSPRGGLAWQPLWYRADSSRVDLLFKLSGGYYYQPPFYRELRAQDGSLNPDPRAQRSIHLVLGADYNITLWNRPFKIIGELYHKQMRDLVPYEVDNVRIRYYAFQRATGHATGLDFKINGEFVSGVDSWFSLSLMQTRENIEGDGHGFIPRPTNQLLNIGMFFQDYLPGNDNFKTHLSFLYGSRMYHGPPNTARHLATLRLPSYFRVDLGFSMILKGLDPDGRPEGFLAGSAWAKPLESIWLAVEVFNLLDVSNVISYQWISIVPNSVTPVGDFPDQFGVPNRLTARRLNLRLNLRF